MTKKHIILIIVSVLTIAGVTTFLIFNNILKNDLGDMSWIDEEPGETDEELVFKDVPKKHWASQYIQFLTAREIMNASGDENFYPDAEITNEEFIKAVALISFTGINFREMSGETSFDEAVKLLEQSNVLSKNQITNTNKNKKISKIQVADILAKTDIKLRNNKQKIVDLLFTDLKNTDEVEIALLSHSVARGFWTNEVKNFYPNSSITRAELAQVLYCFINK